MEENNDTQKSYSLDDLSRLSGFSIRTIRFYIQKGYIPPPSGKKRGSYYTDEHLELLLKIKRLASKHRQLKDIKDFKEDDMFFVEPPIGSINICSHINLGKGLTLVVDVHKARISSENLRQLAEEIYQVAEKFTNKGNEA